MVLLSLLFVPEPYGPAPLKNLASWAQLVSSLGLIFVAASYWDQQRKSKKDEFQKTVDRFLSVYDRLLGYLEKKSGRDPLQSASLHEQGRFQYFLDEMEVLAYQITQLDVAVDDQVLQMMVGRTASNFEAITGILERMTNQKVDRDLYPNLFGFLVSSKEALEALQKKG